ncbi:Lin1244/Lin1753 domain-containing protein [Bacteroides sp. 51]|uniref:Lin1244/Lin1753 domain-containing protein n=1 Tax=Bacteroides sp. 51 TaxID=2302938 RepID=UPI0013D7B571|nr:Lin1244/Lin1753 domain-containing protein [Bacteroides sp. 51]NDV84912.1 DUF4373 domain-containing protein [Bacteroides sp. 51]
MKNDQYFPHDATAGNNIKLMILIESEGARGYGVYWYLLEFLRQQAGYKGKLKMLDMLARRVKTTRAVVKRIITDYALFAIEGELFYSPGLVERMKPLDSKRAAKSEQCRRAAGSKWLRMSECADADALQEEEKDKEEKRISSLNPSKGKASPQPSPKEREEEGGGNSSVSTQTEIKTPPEYAHNKATHNLEGLMRSLDALGVRDAKEVNAILTLSDYGRLEGVIWQLLYHTKWGKIQQPGRFLIAGVKKGSG